MTDYERNLETFDEWASVGAVFAHTEGNVFLLLPEICHSIGLRLAFLNDPFHIPPLTCWKRAPGRTLLQVKEDISRGYSARLGREGVKHLAFDLGHEGVKVEDKFLNAEEYVEMLKQSHSLSPFKVVNGF